MAVYNTKNATDLYWACNEGFKVGRDPMGIQNCSITLYGQMLPGMTNLTGHIRYYSLYCWLLTEYNNDYKSAQQYNVNQRDFIRRAELIMAFIMSGHNQNSVVGSLFLEQKRCHKDIKGYYMIKEGADYEQTDKYWTYGSGAFGQYYLGALVYLQLVRTEDNWFYTRPKGKELAYTFCRSVSDDVRKRYIDVICRGRLSEEDIVILQPLGINQLTVGSSEWYFLNNLLILPDKNGSSLRRESIKLFLEALTENCTINDFPELQYKQYAEGHPVSKFGWHYYYLCETIHYAIESIFWLILETAGANNYLALNKFLDMVTTIILDENEEDISNYTFDNVTSLLSRHEIPIMRNELVDTVKKGLPEQAAMKAFLLLIKCYDSIMPQKETFDRFEKHVHLKEQFGYITQFMQRYVGRNQGFTAKKAIKNIVKTIMNDHTTVACRKMGNSMLDLRKFLIEDGCIFLVEIRKPQFTNPRTHTLFNFLTDLHYLENGRLTNIAKEFIDNYE